MQALNGFSHFGQCPWYWPAYQDGSLRQIWRDEFGGARCGAEGCCEERTRGAKAKIKVSIVKPEFAEGPSRAERH